MTTIAPRLVKRFSDATGSRTIEVEYVPTFGPGALRPRLTTPRPLTWPRLLRQAAIAELAILLSTGLVLGDLLSLALALVVLAGFGLLRSGGRRALLGAVVLGLVFADIAVYTLSGAVSHLLSREPARALLVPAALAGVSLGGFVAAAATLVRRGDPAAGTGVAGLARWGAVGLLAVLVGAGAALGSSQPRYLAAHPGDVSLTSQSMAYSRDRVVADATDGQVTVHLANRDLFWHTFTVDALGVDLKVPVNGSRSITFNAAPGVYEFYCSVPGHDLLGMRGTLVVNGK